MFYFTVQLDLPTVFKFSHNKTNEATKSPAVSFLFGDTVWHVAVGSSIHRTSFL